MKYRKKPVVIEAVKWTGGNIAEIAEFTGYSVDFETADGTPDTALYVVIQTLEGVMFGSIGDYIIKGVDGEFYPCKPDIFEKTYEPIIKSKWLNEDMQTDTISCFVCGFQLPDAELATPYCPNCGAKMDV